ncbi:hypothetical protein EOK75_20230 (plasmid) [Pseudorhodobacter turbinis]|uniref:SMP domain-containing protein n=1 Tax=Pseudorhodobacter turbinis TaxID=2500533 RepID=A0A4P8EMN2_9RHOB|nr:hypothetical protein EOK75_20230 [Pseudorhodobacter turbinis]
MSDSPADEGASRAAAEAYGGEASKDMAKDIGRVASASVIAASQSSRSTSQSVTMVDNDDSGVSTTRIMPEVALDENAARAAAEAYRAEARQTSILESIAATPDVMDLGQQETKATNATAAANPYGQVAVAESGSSNAFVSAAPLNKVA